jgi:hypothetical protein
MEYELMRNVDDLWFVGTMDVHRQQNQPPVNSEFDPGIHRGWKMSETTQNG